jgi:hypothetical protein
MLFNWTINIEVREAVGFLELEMLVFSNVANRGLKDFAETSKILL